MVPDYGYLVQTSDIYIFFSFFVIILSLSLLVIWSKNWSCIFWWIWYWIKFDFKPTSNLFAQNRYTDLENNLYRIMVMPSYLVYVLLKISNFTELKRGGKNQKGRLRLDGRLMCFVTYLLCHPLWVVTTHLL